MRVETVECKRSRLQVDAVYVVRTSNGFMDKVKEELEKGEWCKQIHLLTETTCSKHDIFNHSMQADYDTVLILNDTCFLNTSVNDANFADINACLTQHRSERYVYYLGCLPLSMVSLSNHNYRTFAVDGYAAIYSKAFIAYALQRMSSITNWDLFQLVHCVCYTYTFPLTFTNSNIKESQNTPLYFKTIVCFAKFVVQTVSFDGQHVLGYKLCYVLAKYTIFLVLVLILFVIILALNLLSISSYIKQNYPLLNSVYGRIKRKASTVLLAFRSSGTSTHPREISMVS